MADNDPRLPDGIRLETGRALNGQPVGRFIFSAQTANGSTIDVSAVLRPRQLRALGALALKQADLLERGQS